MSGSFGGTMDPKVWTQDEIDSLMRERDHLRCQNAEHRFKLSKCFNAMREILPVLPEVGEAVKAFRDVLDKEDV